MIDDRILAQEVLEELSSVIMGFQRDQNTYITDFRPFNANYISETLNKNINDIALMTYERSNIRGGAVTGLEAIVEAFSYRLKEHLHKYFKLDDLADVEAKTPQNGIVYGLYYNNGIYTITPTSGGGGTSASGFGTTDVLVKFVDGPNGIIGDSPMRDFGDRIITSGGFEISGAAYIDTISHLLTSSDRILVMDENEVRYRNITEMVEEIDLYYTKLELVTPGSATIDWDNIINVPSFEISGFGFGTPNYVTKFTNSSGTIGDSQIIDDGERVSVGLSANAFSRLMVKVDDNSGIGVAVTENGIFGGGVALGIVGQYVDQGYINIFSGGDCRVALNSAQDSYVMDRFAVGSKTNISTFNVHSDLNNETAIQITNVSTGYSSNDSGVVLGVDNQGMGFLRYNGYGDFEIITTPIVGGNEEAVYKVYNYNRTTELGFTSGSVRLLGSVYLDNITSATSSKLLVIDTNNKICSANTSALGAQPLDSTLTALSELNATVGFIYQTGADIFTKYQFGNSVNTVCQGNDSRLSDPRTPTAHPLVSSYHTASGLTSGHFFKATGSSTFGFVAHGLTYSDVGAASSAHNHDVSNITTGTLSVVRGGTGASTFTAGYLRANLTNAFTTVASIPWTDITGTPTSYNPTSHSLVSSYHTASGLTSGHFFKATGPSTFGFVAHGLTYSDVGAQPIDATLTALAALNSSVGFVYQTGVDTFTKYGFGGSGAATTVSRSDHNHSGVYEPVISAGTTGQYWRWDKTWQILNTSVVAEGTNLYFTNQRAVSALLSNLSNGRIPFYNGSYLASGPFYDSTYGDLAVTGRLIAGTYPSSTTNSENNAWIGRPSHLTNGSISIQLGGTDENTSFSIVNRAFTKTPFYVSGAAPNTSLHVDSYGTVSIGANQSEPWHTDYKVLQMGIPLSIFTDTSYGYLQINTFINASRQYVARSTGGATQMAYGNTGFYWYIAPSVAAGTIISNFPEIMRLTSDGLNVNGGTVWHSGNLIGNQTGHSHNIFYAVGFEGLYGIQATWVPINGIYRWRLGSNYSTPEVSVAHSDLSTNSDTLDNYHSSNFIGKNGNAYYQADNWIQLSGVCGLYNPNSGSGTEFSPTDKFFGSHQMVGSKNNYAGLVLHNSSVVATFMSHTSNIAAGTGVYQQSNNRWQWYHTGTDLYIGRPSVDTGTFMALHAGHVSANYVPVWNGTTWTSSIITSQSGVVSIFPPGGDGIQFSGDNGTYNHVKAITSDNSSLFLESRAAYIHLTSVNQNDDFPIQMSRSVQIFENLRVDGNYMSNINVQGAVFQKGIYAEKYNSVFAIANCTTSGVRALVSVSGMWNSSPPNNSFPSIGHTSDTIGVGLTGKAGFYQITLSTSVKISSGANSFTDVIILLVRSRAGVADEIIMQTPTITVDQVYYFSVSGVSIRELLLNDEIKVYAQCNNNNNVLSFPTISIVFNYVGRSYADNF